MTDERLKKLITAVTTLPYHRYIDFKVTRCRDGECEIRWEIRSDHLNAFKAVHGGFYYTLCDVAAFLAVCTLCDDDTLAVTSDINISILSAVSLGTLIFTATVLKKGKRSAFIETKVFDENGKLIVAARITKTFIHFPNMSIFLGK